jgi:hypothetical protein
MDISPMLEIATLVVPSLPEAAVLRHPPVLAGGEVMPVRWTSELLGRLDWMKIVELVRALAVAGGCELGGTRIWPDGMAEFPMTQGKGGTAETKLVTRLAAWNRWSASVRCIETFAADLAARREGRGVYLAPGGVSPSAVSEAARRGIDVLDAEALAAALNALPGRHSKFFHERTLAGNPFVPSCPVCLRSLSHSVEANTSGASAPVRPDLSYHRNDVVAERVVARRIEILRKCEVHFIREVRAHDVFVQGMAIGDFLCEGALVLDQGAVLCGNVAARSVVVRPGGELRGETRILPAAVALAERSPVAWLWGCANMPKQEGCGEVGFVPH